MPRDKKKLDEYILVSKESIADCFVIIGDKEHCRQNLSDEYFEDPDDPESRFRMFKIEKECKIERTTTISIDGDHGKKAKK